jgi:hypothetical protein
MRTSSLAANLIAAVVAAIIVIDGDTVDRMADDTDCSATTHRRRAAGPSACTSEGVGRLPQKRYEQSCVRHP